MAARDVRKNMNLFVDGRGYAGQIQEFTAPKLTQVTEDFRAGGMLGPIKLTMGMEPMESMFSLVSYDANILAKFGVVEGAQMNCSAREVLESFDGGVKPVRHSMRGKITEIDPGASKPGELQPLSFTMSVSYYKLEIDGVVIHEVDLQNMVHVVNGTDTLSAQRAALGL